MEKPKTIFCDIDGTLLYHYGNLSKQIINEHKILPNTLEAINYWDKLGYCIILTSGRKESLRKITEEQLNKLGIYYDQLILGISGGVRILINDKKENGIENTAYAINLVRNRGLEFYNFDSKFIIYPDKELNKIEKPWGFEELLEYNQNYILKKLFMKKNECCSIQYHELKKETIYVLNGKLKLYIGNDINNLEEKIMLPNDVITINPYTIHRMEAIEDSYYLETSTPELWDVVRLKDNYNRT